MLEINTHDMLFSFFNEQVRLPENKQKEMRSRRDSNRDRLVKGLEKNSDPAPTGHLIQGSYAMRTMIQREGNDYDIDDGVLFNKDDLKGSKGADKSTAEARKMVREALNDERFNRAPEVLKRCVRVYYDAGYHIDIPVYREWQDEDSQKNVRELAASDGWRESDPKKITDWFNETVTASSPEEKQPYQLRRVVCLLKAWAASRNTWNLPSGLIFSVLTDKHYLSVPDRDDTVFIDILERIRFRLELGDKTAIFPVDGEDFASGREAKMDNLLDKIDEWLPTLSILSTKDCTTTDAAKAWKKFFNSPYFDQYISDEKEEARSTDSAIGLLATGTVPSSPVTKKGDNTFG
ncbi:MAG: cyclic GMP-AMP synthase DncV-like nucleotidyltransferase [Halodesulfovibrio sp.]|uniref:cyclic GMP-AMP synthase DncV-like nucleotidyltransferase n=1 Tax=Halodesulfovibrio sp. TaxID=1912772 RepID=UPI00359D4A38